MTAKRNFIRDAEAHQKLVACFADFEPGTGEQSPAIIRMETHGQSSNPGPMCATTGQVLNIGTKAPSFLKPILVFEPERHAIFFVAVLGLLESRSCEQRQVTVWIAVTPGFLIRTRRLGVKCEDGCYYDHRI